MHVWQDRVHPELFLSVLKRNRMPYKLNAR